LTPTVKRELSQAYLAAERSLLLLDYEGTLVPVSDRPRGVKPDVRLIRLLRRLSVDLRTKVVILSNRPQDLVGRWFVNLDVGLVAESGVWTRRPGEEWASAVPENEDWQLLVKPLLERVTSRTPGSRLVVRDYALLWDYADARPELAEFRVSELKPALVELTADQQAVVVDREQALEVRLAGVGKGYAVMPWVSEHQPDFILAIGDGVTDEEMFAALPDEAWTIHARPGRSLACHNLPGPRQVRALLRTLAG
jgi:trehalose 6-phosphate synthase/phosphatase